VNSTADVPTLTLTRSFNLDIDVVLSERTRSVREGLQVEVIALLLVGLIKIMR
jgi:hypothetical protein